MDIEQIIAEEGDFEHWTDEETGFLCCIVRSEYALTWNGYVQVPKNYAAYGMDIDQLGHIAVHRNVSYSGDRLEDGNYWVGFDCSHAGDLLPAAPRALQKYGEYRTKEYATHQVTRLAWQLHLMGTGEPDLKLV